MNLIYLFKEKKSNKIIYVGSSSRPAERMKEHKQTIDGKKPTNMKLYKYIAKKGLKLYKDIEVCWVDCADTVEEMYKTEEEYFYKYRKTILNDRPGEFRKGNFNPKRRRVVCLNDGKIYNTVTDCAKYYGIKRTTLSNVVNGYKEATYVNGVRYNFEFYGKKCND